MSQNQFRKKYILLIFAFTGILFIITSLLYATNSLQWANNFFYDLNTHWRSSEPGSEHLVLVLMDEKSASELKRVKGTWARTHLDQSLQNLCAAGAEIIGLDMILSAPDPDPAIDASLARTIYDCNNVVLGRVSSAQGVSDILPLPAFQDGMIGDGFIDVAPDRDEVLRRIRFLNAKPMGDGNLMLLPSFSLEIARTFLNIEFVFDFSGKESMVMGTAGETQIKLPYPELVINYKGDYSNFANLSFADVVKNRFDHDLVKGKIVLIGSSLAIQRDFFVTPFSRFKRAAIQHQDKFGKVIRDNSQLKELGVACHAWAISNILNQQFIRQVPRNFLYIAILLMAVMGIIFYIPGLRVSFSIIGLISALTAVIGASYFLLANKLLWIDISPLLLIMPAQFVGGTFLQRYYQRKKTEQITNLIGRYVSPMLSKQLVQDEMRATLSGHRQVVTIFFSDIRGFTTLSEQLGAEETGRLLNTYFDVMIPIIFEQNGTLDKLIGDAIMAFYGAPVPVDKHPVDAAATSLKMLNSLQELKKRNIQGIDRIDIGIGINTGEVTIGNMGSQNFMDYTVIGDSVNLAARLEGLNKIYGTRIIITEFTAEHLQTHFIMRQLDRVKVKGKDKAVTIFELVGFKGQVEINRLELIELFEQALSHYSHQEWEKAKEYFEKVREIDPEDGPANLYITRIALLKNTSLPEDWDGTTKLDSK